LISAAAARPVQTACAEQRTDSSRFGSGN
jgi:hypothetical protein